MIDFTRFDLKAKEPADANNEYFICNRSLMNRLNQKETGSQDNPIDLVEMIPDEKAIKKRHSELINK
jgi:hypothetical protein